MVEEGWCQGRRGDFFRAESGILVGEDRKINQCCDSSGRATNSS
jgi:hypothetical protein